MVSGRRARSRKANFASIDGGSDPRQRLAWHALRDPRQRGRVGRTVGVPVVLRLDEGAERGALEEHGVAALAPAYRDVPEGLRHHRALALGAGELVHDPTVLLSARPAAERARHSCRVGTERPPFGEYCFPWEWRARGL